MLLIGASFFSRLLEQLREDQIEQRSDDKSKRYGDQAQNEGDVFCSLSKLVVGVTGL